MRFTLIIAAMCLSVVQSQAQTKARIFDPSSVTPSNAGTGDTFRVTFFKRMIATGYIGGAALDLHRMGDEAAAAVIQAIGAKQLDRPEIANIIQILRTAYEHPMSIGLSSRKPEATMFLLAHLAMIASDDPTKRLIADAQSFVASEATKVGAMTADK